MRRTTSLTALVLGATLLAPATQATAAGETCRGEAATIVGTGPDVQGTEGRDVIVTGASHRVFAGAGNDVVCVTEDGAGINIVIVDAGAGDDVVDGTAMRPHFYLTAILGDGADTFVGGAGDDRVVAGAAPGPYSVPPSEAERDVIDTGDGTDSVTSGGPGLPNDDEIRTGNGDDYVTWSGTMGAKGVLDGGEGADRLRPRASGQTFRIDLTAQTLVRDGVRAASFSSFEQLFVAPEPDLGTVEILGTAGDDIVDILAPATVRADLGEGNDNLGLVGTKPGSRIDLGSGSDLIRARSSDGSVEVDLAKGSLVMAGSPAALAGVENAFVSATQAKLIGDDHANFLTAIGCVATIDGRGGKDGISHRNYDGDLDSGYDCSRGRATLRGGSGNDKIDGGKQADRIYGGPGRDRIETGPAARGKNKAWGGPGNDKLYGGSSKDVLDGGAGNDRLKGSEQADVLRGGPGHDRGVGGPGRDTCRTEIRKSCEIR